MAEPNSVNQEKARLHKLETQIDEAQARRKKLHTAADRLKGETNELIQSKIKAAARIQAKEEDVLHSEQQLESLEDIEGKMTRLLERRSGELANTLAALQRLSRQPDSAFLTRPETALSAVRSASLLSTVVPDLRTEAINLGEEIRALNSLREEIVSERNKLARDVAQLKTERRTLERLVAKKRRQQSQFIKQASEQEKQARRFASKAKSVQDLINKLNAAQIRQAQKAKKASPQNRQSQVDWSSDQGRPFSMARENLALPVRGRIASGFGKSDITGSPLRGITIRTLGQAQVTAPYDGRIVYAGPFRDYGQLLIIAHGEGYHTLLSGMSRIDGVVGQWVLTGEPIGNMGPDDINRSTKKPELPELYVELRRNGEPINPLPWLTANKGKVTG